MTTTSFFCRKKALWPFPPITLPRPEPFVNPTPQILQLLCRAARLCATVPTSAVVFRQIPPLFRRPGPSMIMVQRGSGQRRPGSQSRRRRCDRRWEQRRPVQRLCAPRPDLTQPLNKPESPCPFRHLPGWTGGFCMKEKKWRKRFRRWYWKLYGGLCFALREDDLIHEEEDHHGDAAVEHRGANSTK